MKNDFTNSELVYDTEANDLLHKVTKLWCIYFIDVETAQGYLYHDYPEFHKAVVVDNGKEYTIPPVAGSLKDGARALYSAKKIIAHNANGYDIFVLNKFFPAFKLDKVFPKSWDTLIQSKVQQYDRRPVKGYKGIHGLDVWGGRLGHKKPPVDDFSKITPWLLHRCIQDVQINFELYKFLEEERKKALEIKGLDFSEGLVHDHLYRFNATLQELNGAKLDVEHAQECVKDLDNKIEELKDELEPKLPMTMSILSQKCTWDEVYKALEWTEWPKDKHPSFYKTRKELRERVGVSKAYDLKPAAKPTTKLFVANGNYSKGVAKYFDIPENSSRKERLVDGPFVKVGYTPSAMTQHAVVKNYLLNHCGWVPTEYNYKKDKDGSLMRDDSRQLIKTSPKLTEDSYDSIKGGIGKSIAEYNTYSHRRRFLENDKDDEKGLLNVVRPDGRISCGLNVFGTATGRSSQYGYVNAPGAGALYGGEIRKCIVAPEGKILVGVDQKSSQLSIAAFYANNQEYYTAVAEGLEFTQEGLYVGQSAHCYGARAFGLVSQEEYERAVVTQDKDLIASITLRRKASKACSFGTLFGCSGAKLASMAGVPENKGNKMKTSFLDNMGLTETLKVLEKMAGTYKKGQGSYLELPFGYWVWCKSPHKYLNYLCQGVEAACQKVAVNYFGKEVTRRNLEAKVILQVHDEILIEAPESIGDEVGTLMCESYTYASDECYNWVTQNSKFFSDRKFKFDLNGGYSLGKNYYECH